MVTANKEESNLIRGFQAGADDYIVKPFSPRELVLRIKAILRRTTNPKYKRAKRQTKDLLILPRLIINCETYQVTLDGFNVRLAPTEFDILRFLAERPNEVFTREFLLKEIWGDEFAMDTRVLYTSIKRLRNKLREVSSSAGDMISTVRGVGYKLKTVEDY